MPFAANPRPRGACFRCPRRGLRPLCATLHVQRPPGVPRRARARAHPSSTRGRRSAECPCRPATKRRSASNSPAERPSRDPFRSSGISTGGADKSHSPRPAFRVSSSRSPLLFGVRCRLPLPTASDVDVTHGVLCPHPLLEALEALQVVPEMACAKRARLSVPAETRRSSSVGVDRVLLPGTAVTAAPYPALATVDTASRV